MTKKWIENKINIVDIPHLNYKVYYGISSKEFTGRQEKSVMFAENTNKNTGTIIFRKKPTELESGTVAHEIVHILQYICKRRNITMEDEIEHMGYLMHYIFNEIYDREYSVFNLKKK